MNIKKLEEYFNKKFEKELTLLLNKHGDIIKLGLIPPYKYLITENFKKRNVITEVTQEDWSTIDLLMKNHDQKHEFFAKLFNVSETEASEKLSKVYSHFGIPKEGSMNRKRPTINKIREILLEMEGTLYSSTSH